LTSLQVYKKASEGDECMNFLIIVHVRVDRAFKKFFDNASQVRLSDLAYHLACNTGAAQLDAAHLLYAKQRAQHMSALPRHSAVSNSTA
jgi:hypothetical protein